MHAIVRAGLSTRFTAAWLLLLLLMMAAGSRVQAADADSTDTGASASSLAATSAPPWNPPQLVRGSEFWEKALRTPFLIAAAPIALVAAGGMNAYSWAEQAGWVRRIRGQVLRAQSAGLIAGPAPLGDRTGLAAQVGWRPPFFKPLVGTLAASTRGYDRGRLALETRHAELAYQYDWRPKELFFGIGPGSSERGTSNYVTQSEALIATLHLPAPRAVPQRGSWVGDAADDPATHVPPRLGLDLWGGPRSAIVLDGREHAADHPPLLERFPSDPLGLIGERLDQMVYGARAEYDERAGRPHWWKGGRVAVEVERRESPPRALALRRAGGPEDDYTRWTYEGDWATSFWRDPRTFRFSARVVDRVGTPTPGQFLLTDLAGLGASEGLNGFDPGRFRDADLILGQIGYIAPISRFLELELHAESGTVAPHLQSATLRQFQQSFGIALRGRTPTAMVGQVGLEWSRETTRLRFSFGGIR